MGDYHHDVSRLSGIIDQFIIISYSFEDELLASNRKDRILLIAIFILNLDIYVFPIGHKHMI